MIQHINSPPDSPCQAEPDTRSEMRGDNRTLTELIKELRDETTDLMRQEVELAKTETSEKAAKLARNIAYTAIGVLIAYAGLMFLLWAATYGLMIALNEAGVSENVSPWLAPLITGLIVTGIGVGFLIKSAATLKNETLMPERTMRSLEENKQWLTAKLT